MRELLLDPSWCSARRQGLCPVSDLHEAAQPSPRVSAAQGRLEKFVLGSQDFSKTP